MSVKYFLSFLILLIIVAASAWMTVLFFVNPDLAGSSGIGLFYGSLFLLLVGLITLGGYGARSLFKRPFVKRAFELQASFRQAIFFSFIFILILLWQAKGLLNWFNGIILVIVVTAVEFLIISREHHQNVSQPVTDIMESDEFLS